MKVQIPLDTNQPDQEFSCDLEGVTYVFRFTFNYRSSRWMMSVKTESGDIIIAGVPLVNDFPLLSRFVKEDLPPGMFLVEDLSDLNREPGELSFGSTHGLFYIESGDLA